MIQPLHDRVAVRLRKPPEKIGGIHLPQSAQENELDAEVIAVGPGRKLSNGSRAPMSVKPGDFVRLGRYAGYEVEFGGEKLILVKDGDILARLG